ncbi:MAG: von Willebrand factor type A domain-containing protein [Bacteroidota bacterium]|nr:von Willebrand factor type A domain-containing protein [Bacteroidota bacterium]
MRTLLTLAIGIFALTMPSTTAAQSEAGTITGQVTDMTSLQPLAGAIVTVEGTRIRTATGATGQYRLVSVPAGEYTVSVTFVGYVTQQQQVTVFASRESVADFALQTDTQSVQELVLNYKQGGRRISMDALGANFNTESYAHISENDFRLVSTSPLSTFSVDVDRASYSNIRRFIQDGKRPPVDAVRIEEMINYFPYRKSEVSGDQLFAITTEVWQAPWKPKHQLVKIGLQTRSIDLDNLPPNSLVFLLDVSGSMGTDDKLPLLKKAFALLVDQLRPHDQVAIVVYAGAAGLVLPMTPGTQREEILGALELLHAGGSTAGGQGIRLAYETARKHFIESGNNRVILATDGDFNIGPSSDAEMVRLIEKERESGVFLTVLGFGTGNLKDSKMEQIADHGNGNFHYVDGLLEAKKVLVEEMGGTLVTLAKDVKIQVEFNPARVAGYRLIGYENRLLADEDFNDDAKDAGELGAGHTVTALFELVPAGVPVPRENTDELRYQPQADAPQVNGFEDELMFVKVRYKDPDETKSKRMDHAVIHRQGSPTDDFRFASAVAGFGMLLRDSDHAGDFTLTDVLELARSGKGNDPRGYRGEFIRLVEATRDLQLLTAETDGDE